MFCFTIRDLLWLMVMVGIVAAWSLDHRAASRRSERDDRLWRSQCDAIFEMGFIGEITSDDKVILRPFPPTD